MAANALVEALEETFCEARALDAPLDDRLGLVRDAVRRLAPEFASAVDRFVARLEVAEAGDRAPGPGDPMPEFFLPDETGSLVSLSGLLKRGPVAVVFHRGHWCPYCRLNAAALAEAAAGVSAAGGQIVAITPDLRRFALALKQEAGADFPFLTDIDNGYALSLNLAIWVDEAMAGLIAAAGWNLPDYQGNQAWMLPVPATFVVGQDGIVKARFVDPDYRRRMAIEDLVAAFPAAN